MTFFESIQTCFKKYATFAGRASRSEFWWWILFTFLASAALGIFSDKLSALFSLVVLLPTVAVATRRLHDVDKGGWWQLIGLIPIIGWIVMIVWCAQAGTGPNRFDEPAAIEDRPAA